MTIDHLRGFFLTVEGLDGSGLTTQADLLRAALEAQDQDVFLTKEPSEGPAGAMIRLGLARRLQSMLDGKPTRLDEETLALLFAADRMDHLYNEILPKLRAGITVICDRYYLSSFAYQSLSLDLEWLKQLNSRARRPDLTVFLDVPPEICERRMKKQRWHVELYEETDILRKVRDNYLRVIGQLQRQGEAIEIVDGVAPPREVHQAILKTARRYIKMRPAAELAANGKLWEDPDQSDTQIASG